MCNSKYVFCFSVAPKNNDSGLANKKQREFVCDICKKCLSRKKLLERHLKQHMLQQKQSNIGKSMTKMQKKDNLANVFLFVCEICNAIFESDGDKRRHMHDHREDWEKKSDSEVDINNMKQMSKPLTCNLQLTSFGKIRNVTIHIYPCMLCEETFTSAAMLKSHVKKHVEVSVKCIDNKQLLTDEYSNIAKRKRHSSRSKIKFVSLPLKIKNDSSSTENLKSNFEETKKQLKMKSNNKRNSSCDITDTNLTAVTKPLLTTTDENINYTLHKEYIVAELETPLNVNSIKGKKKKVRVTSDEIMQDMPQKLISETTTASTQNNSGTISPIVNSEDTLARLSEDNREDQKNIEPPFTCDVCLKEFRFKSSLLDHRMIHTGERRHKCASCNEKFVRRSQLKRHEGIHVTVKPFKCEWCEKSFMLIGDLHMHAKKHNGDTPYTCERCGRSFTKISNLNAHVRTHTGERPFMCCHCGKSFAANSDLTRHIRLHTGEKPYVCSTCKKTFAQLTSLRKHKCRGESRIMENNKLYPLTNDDVQIEEGRNLESHKMLDNTDNVQINMQKIAKPLSNVSEIMKFNNLHNIDVNNIINAACQNTYVNILANELSCSGIANEVPCASLGEVPNELPCASIDEVLKIVQFQPLLI